MRQALARGLLGAPAVMDLREAGTWARLQAITAGLRDEHDIAALELQHARALVALGTELSEFQYRQVAETVDRLEDAIEKVRRPWAEARTGSNDIKAMERQWEAIWGKMDDPVTQAKIQEDCRKLGGRATPKKLPTRKVKPNGRR